MKYMGEPAGLVQRRVINVHADDAGWLQFQMECGHISWAKSLTEATSREHRLFCDAFAEGAECTAGCMSCTAGDTTSLYPVGVRLPVPPPSTPGRKWPGSK